LHHHEWLPQRHTHKWAMTRRRQAKPIPPRRPAISSNLASAEWHGSEGQRSFARSERGRRIEGQRKLAIYYFPYICNACSVISANSPLLLVACTLAPFAQRKRVASRAWSSQLHLLYMAVRLNAWLEETIAWQLVLANNWLQERHEKKKSGVKTERDAAWEGLYHDNGSSLDITNYIHSEHNSALQVLQVRATCFMLCPLPSHPIN
jgi:hypothetical protein